MGLQITCFFTISRKDKYWILFFKNKNQGEDLLYLSSKDEQEDILALIKLINERLPRSYSSCSIQFQIAVTLQ